MPKFYVLIIVLAALGRSIAVEAQVSYTSNDINPAYTGKFRPGVNLSYLPPWSTYQLGDLAAGNPALGIPGVGARSTRPGLFDNVLDTYGYGLNVDAHDYYRDLGLEELTAIVGFPSDRHRDWANRYCSDPDKWNALFEGIYEPIWDDGSDGTPYNEDNAYAAYLYQIVSLYTDNVRFWEIWNEPGLYKGNDSPVFWAGPDYPGSWWLNDPDPCDYTLHAPIEHFVRTLRISYEVIKTISPDDYVAIAGVGSQSFLDAILRNTDNPVDGSITPEYPNLGGAYIDVLGFHTYPHLDGSTLFAPTGHFARHSDGAADGIIQRRLGGYQQVLSNYGYDGIIYPKKQHICTEINVPRRVFSGDYFGGGDAQINFIGKALIALKSNDVHQMHVYSISDKVEESAAGFEFDLMGLYKTLDGVQPYNQQLNDEGIAYKTVADLLYPTEFDEAASHALNAPAGVRAYAFAKPDGGYVYALWAETLIDRSEQASATYSFPTNLNLGNLTKYTWDHSRSGITTSTSPSGIALDARPIYLATSSDGTANAAPEATLSTAAAIVDADFDVQIAWSEAVVGFSLADVVVANGTIMSLLGSGTTYTARIRPTEVGEVALVLPAGVARDLLDLGSLASDTLTVTSTRAGGTSSSTDADVELHLAASATSVVQYERVVLTLTARNTGGRIAENVIVEFPLPNRYSYVASVSSQGDYSPWTANWNVGDLQPDAAAILELELYLLTADARTAYAQVIATRQFDADSSPGNGACCTPREDDEAAVTINGSGPAQQSADLALTLASPQAAINPDGSFTVQLTVINHGPDATAGVQARLNLPAGLTTTGSTIPAGTQLNGAVWSINRLNLGQSRTLQLELLAANPAASAVITAEIIASSTPDPDSEPNNNQSGEDDRSVLVVNGATMPALADVELSMSSDVRTFRRGHHIGFTVEAVNTGGTAVQQLVVYFPRPVSTAYRSHQISSGFFDRTFGVWRISLLEPGQRVTLDLEITALRDAPLLTAFAQVLSSSERDSDSTPNNRMCCTPIEDDEAAVRLDNRLDVHVPSHDNFAFDFEAPNPPEQQEFSFHGLEQVLGKPGFNIHFTTTLATSAAYVVDPLGRIVRTIELATQPGTFHVPVDLSGLQAGVYTLVVETSQGMQEQRVVHLN